MRLPTVCALSLCLLGCKGPLSQVIKPSPPAEAAQLCKEMPLAPKTDDEAAVFEADLIDLYVDCAVRHNRLVRWLQE